MIAIRHCDCRRLRVGADVRVDYFRRSVFARAGVSHVAAADGRGTRMGAGERAVRRDSPPAIGIAVSFSLLHGLGYVLTVAAPAYWLGHLSLLARPLDDRRRRTALHNASRVVSDRSRGAVDGVLRRTDHDSPAC